MSEALVKHIEKLPELDQSAFPPVPKHTNLIIPFNSPLQRYERECLLGIVALVASLSHKWRPVSIAECRSILLVDGKDTTLLKEEILVEARALARDGYGEIIRVQDMDYFVPKPDFVQHFRSRQFAIP